MAGPKAGLLWAAGCPCCPPACSRQAAVRSESGSPHTAPTHRPSAARRPIMAQTWTPSASGRGTTCCAAPTWSCRRDGRDAALSPSPWQRRVWCAALSLPLPRPPTPTASQTVQHSGLHACRAASSCWRWCRRCCTCMPPCRLMPRCTRMPQATDEGEGYTNAAMASAPGHKVRQVGAAWRHGLDWEAV